MRRKLLWTLLLLTCATALSIALLFRADMNRAYARVAARGVIVESPYGLIEYSQRGSGPAVLVIHGSGGGYDQGELIANTLLGEDFRWIAPSRFGYLRSNVPDGATFDDQAHAYVWLLDRLKIDKVAVVALSHGGPSALLLAALYPDRVSSLALISAGVASASSTDQAQANARGDALTRIFRHDFLYWAVARFFRPQLTELLGANKAVLGELAPERRQLVDRIIDFMNPVAPRSAGVAFDNRAAMPNGRIVAIRAPTLVFHATDDGLQLFHNAEFAVAHIPGAKLVRFEQGGHLVICLEQDSIRRQTQRHVRDNADAQ
jgi:2-hydroxy-6-oxonona-2,4-dienedioate hydrolase